MVKQYLILLGCGSILLMTLAVAAALSVCVAMIYIGKLIYR